MALEVDPVSFTVMKAELCPHWGKPVHRIKDTPAKSNAALTAEPPPFLPPILVKSNFYFRISLLSIVPADGSSPSLRKS